MTRDAETTSRLEKRMLRYERVVVMSALRRYDGNISESARWLGISRRTLHDKVREHELDGEARGLRVEAGVKGPRAYRATEVVL